MEVGLGLGGAYCCALALSRSPARRDGASSALVSRQLSTRTGEETGAGVRPAAAALAPSPKALVRARNMVRVRVRLGLGLGLELGSGSRLGFG